MARPKSKTTVSVLRSIVGISAEKFANLIGRSIHTVKSLESGRLALSEDLAMKISVETGVDPHWLLDGDPQFPPFLDIALREYLSSQPDEDYQEALYSKEVFEHVRAARLARESPFPESEHTPEEQIICLLFRLICIYLSARNNGEDRMALYRLHGIEGDLAKEFGLSLDEPAFELASKASLSLQKLANRLKRDQKDLRDLAFEPGNGAPVKFLELCHRIAKAMRAINAPRKGDSKAKRKTRPVPTKEETGAQLMAATGTERPLTEAEIRALFDPVRKRMEAKGYTKDQIRARLETFRKRQREAEGKIFPSST